MKQFIRLVSDVGPLGVFFLVYKFYGLIYATGALIGVTIVITIITFLVEKKGINSTTGVSCAVKCIWFNYHYQR